MRITTFLTFAAVSVGATLSACAVVPEEPEIVMTEPVIVSTIPACYEVAELQRIEIPAVTKTVYGVSVIENPPYEPIEQRTEQKIVVKQAEVTYVKINPTTGARVEVTNLCDNSIQIGRVGPAPGELSGPAVPVG